MDDLSSRLSRLKEKIQSDEKKLTEAETEFKILMKRLKDEFGIKTIDEAEQKLESLTKREAELETKIENMIEDIENEYNT